MGLKSSLAIFLLISFIRPGFASTKNRLLPCLGKEEAYLFKQKKKVPVYKLNQNLINLMVNSPDLELSPKYFKEICNIKLSPSKKLMQLSILRGKEIFTNQRRDRNKIQFFLSQMPQVFFSHLAQIQAGLPNAKCLQREIPEIGYFLERFKYLQADIPEKSLFKEKNKLRTIFTKMNNINLIYEKCKKDTSKE